ncbi:putative transcriptional regulatory protein [Neolecta irregularis DAH-3]|uniref:Putative transcriptional regulatory protein n=1 Tax=Neolecta irregularis (strain DAH-3) TaxID=1198029 RepID=A0A1U7LVK4_NEOID|nr:putative transcriptional regulatory protein [Neolecta irregularis DAH-3]|eukprot:OLL26705.1 putative transcriptional regulatory protein [Neolecta irregularis DAH-3]
MRQNVLEHDPNVILVHVSGMNGMICHSSFHLSPTSSYPEYTAKRGPKKGHSRKVQERFETRLQELEKLLEESRAHPQKIKALQIGIPELQNMSTFATGIGAEGAQNRPLPVFELASSTNLSDLHPGNNMVYSCSNGVDVSFGAHQSFVPDILSDHTQHTISLDPNFHLGSNTYFNPMGWSLLSQGHYEALPSTELMDSLFDIYFQKIWPVGSISNPESFRYSMHLPPPFRPHLGLIYAVLLSGASVSDSPTMRALGITYYERASRYIREWQDDSVQMRTHALLQAMVLLSYYEVGKMDRAWLTIGSAVRLSTKLQLNQLDRPASRLVLPPASDPIIKEERRRVFWEVYRLDSHSASGTGWSMALNEDDIETLMPASDSRFTDNICAGSPGDSLYPLPSEFPSFRSAFVADIYLSALVRRLSEHRNRSRHDVPFLERHRYLENMLIKFELSLPDFLKVQNSTESLVIMVNLTSYLCRINLYEGAVTHAEENGLDAITPTSKLKVAVLEVVATLRILTNVETSKLPLATIFAVFSACRILARFVKTNTDPLYDDLEFLMTVLERISEYRPCAGVFLAQLKRALDAVKQTVDKIIYSPEPRSSNATHQDDTTIRNNGPFK